ncbi:hypothetical protein DFH06DRAFT_1178439 [Mycena polygramma]|nr:hypothetical protein DFH06DRAFT_1178439 [Mycena polygramma]
METGTRYAKLAFGFFRCGVDSQFTWFIHSSSPSTLRPLSAQDTSTPTPEHDHDPRHWKVPRSHACPSKRDVVVHLSCTRRDGTASRCQSLSIYHCRPDKWQSAATARICLGGTGTRRLSFIHHAWCTPAADNHRACLFCVGFGMGMNGKRGKGREGNEARHGDWTG